MAVTARIDPLIHHTEIRCLGGDSSGLRGTSSTPAPRDAPASPPRSTSTMRALRGQLLARPPRRRSATAAPCFPHPTRLSLTAEKSRNARTQAADDMSRHGRAHLTCSWRFADGLVSDRRHVLRCRGATPRRPRRGCLGRSNPAAIRASERSRETAVPGSLIAEAVISRQGWFSGWEAARASGHLRSPGARRVFLLLRLDGP
jgi:hypothetical protein